MRPNLLLALAAFAAAAGSRFAQGMTTAASVADTGPGTARNRGKGRTNRQMQRAAEKKRNVARHRQACRG